MYKVLIVDDEPWSRKVIRQLGEWDKHQLTIAGEAEDGTQGLSFINVLAPDIVITDMRMPGVDGVALLKAMNEQYPDLKIIVMSGYDDFAYLKQAIQSQAKEYLLKPVDPDELNAALARCVRELDQSKQLSVIERNSPQLLDNSALLDAYLELRQIVYGYLLDLNPEGVAQTLDSLLQFLEAEQFDRSRLMEVGHDLTRMLEQFISTSELADKESSASHPSRLPKETVWVTAADTIVQIRLTYNQVMEDLLEIRRKKSKLDLEEVVSYMDRYYKDAITLESIADHFYISKEHLSRSFKVYKGETITEYIVRKRMEKAMQLIVEHKLSIKHAAELTGYMDVAYFYRVFKKYYGFAPGEARKSSE